ncbi:hypothetical protein PV11_09598 [Exophiala sideris]|uniref:AB hydrolase-1 domain-containing protein n=1 Tax=Exophiala sideris TaxID=1016849 RepID=A0A0D1YS88_9EURO|nr:hypothetical protein PV11_09598 [Exophiala sideris]
MPLTSKVSADVFLHVPSSLTTNSTAADNGASAGKHEHAAAVTLVFFITGNPGLIAYYHPFLSLLVERLEKRQDEAESPVVVAGFSLGGFEIARSDDDGLDEELLYPRDTCRIGRPGSGGDNGIYTLREQIELSYARVEALSSKMSSGHGPVKVVLMGHSVGTYIALEIVRLWHERHQHQHSQDMNSSSTDEMPDWTVTSCILLTPTIVDLHKSPSGVLATPLLTGFPVLSALVPSLAHGLLHSVLLRVPSKWLDGLVQRATGMPWGSHGLQTTLAFLRSPSGVKQALVMAGGELKEIRADQWGDEVWGAVEAEAEEDTNTTSPLLYMWFAKEDHWVASTTREEIVKRRGMEAGQIGKRQQKRPNITIDETHGLVHAWCLEQNQIVAERVGEWLEEILES